MREGPRGENMPHIDVDLDVEIFNSINSLLYF